MNQGEIGALLHEAVAVVLKVGGPPLLAALAAGLVMSLVQAVTQVNEPTVAFVPKVAAVVGTLVALGPWMLVTLTDFAHLMFDRVVAAGSP